MTKSAAPGGFCADRRADYEFPPLPFGSPAPTGGG